MKRVSEHISASGAILPAPAVPASTRISAETCGEHSVGNTPVGICVNVVLEHSSPVQMSGAQIPEDGIPR